MVVTRVVGSPSFPTNIYVRSRISQYDAGHINVNAKRQRSGTESMRLKDKIAIVIGAGQSPGEGMGNGRATCLRFAQEGAKILAVDNRLASAEETATLVTKEGGACV